MAVKSETKCGSTRRKTAQAVTFCIKEERNATYKKVSSILQKAEIERTDEERELLFSCSELVKEVSRRIEKRKKVKERLQEVEDPPDLLAEKCQKLAEAVLSATNLVVYTGAGISTAACIPDYRGTNGIWTLLQKGKDIGPHDLTQAEPTITHMALWQLYKTGRLKHVVSQNCDGLHLRSGLPKGVLSEVHGNMYIEVCCQCKPGREYWRLFDVTEHTARFNHRTMRRCYTCMGPLVDTIVHFGERGKLPWPLNWSTACKAADKADVILCIGSSLKVLKKYPWLWGMDKPAKKRPKLYIVNLQWTPKDDQAILKISGKCDEVMKQVMSHMKLDIPNYIRSKDPIFYHATSLHPDEIHTTTQPLLKQPSSGSDVSASCSGTYSIQSPKMETEICKVFGDSLIVKNESTISTYSENFHFVNAMTDTKPLIDDLKVTEEDPFAMLEENEDPLEKNTKMAIILEQDLLQNKGQVISLDSDSLFIDSAVISGGLMLDINISSDQISFYDQVKCDQNSLQNEDINVDCKTFSHCVVGNTHASSSIKNIGCDSGTSSIKGSIYDPSSASGISALTRILEVEHNYSRIPSVDSQASDSKGSKFSLDEKQNKGRKRIKTNRTEDPIGSSSKQSTKNLLTGKQKTQIEKQVCDDKYDIENTLMCSFCKTNYSSNLCLFYHHWTSKFENVTLGSRICECCDTDDDEEEEEDDDSAAVDSGTCKAEGDGKVEADSGKTAKVPNINPGWYGKGYRKRTRRR